MTLAAKDARGDQLPSGGATVAFTTSGGTSAGTIGPVVDNGDGTYSATFTGETPGSATTIGATYNGTSITSVLPTITVTSDVSASESVVSVGSGTVASGSTDLVTLIAKDAAGHQISHGGATVTFVASGGTSTGTFGAVMDNGDGTYVATFTGVLAGTATTVATSYDGTAVSSAAPTIAVVPGSFSPGETLLSPDTWSIASGSIDLVTLAAKDAAGNRLSGGGAAVAFSASGGTSTGTLGAVTDNHDGTYSTAFTGVVAGTTTTLHATYDGAALTSTLPTITVTPGPFSASQSGVSAASSTVVAGLTDLVTLTARDTAGNQIASGGAAVAFSASGGTSTGTFGPVTDNGDGTYTAIFKGVLAGTATTISATYDGTAVNFCTVTVTPSAPPARYLITYQPGGAPDSQDAEIRAAGATPIRTIASLRVQIVSVPVATRDAVLSALSTNPNVLSVTADTARTVAGVVNDPGYAQQWALPAIGWDQVYGTVFPSGSAVVALLDTGVDASHPDLAGKIIPGTSMLDGSDGLTDPDGHGTALAGIIAAQTNNAVGIAGVGYAGVSVMPVTVLDIDGVGYDSDIVAGITYAVDHGANVILMAFSSPGFSTEMQSAIDYAWNHGVVVVAATGNGASSSPTYPAGGVGVVGVSNTDQSDALNPSSNYGLDAFMAAPGTGIYTTAAGGGYTTITGTSASAAIVAGAAAFMHAVDPSLSPSVIVGRLARNAAAGDFLQTGNGRIDMALALADTSTVPVEPAGAGVGGPYVSAPYVAAAGLSIKATFSAPTQIVGATETWSLSGWQGSAGDITSATVLFPAGFVIPASPAVTVQGNGALCTVTGGTGTTTGQSIAIAITGTCATNGAVGTQLITIAGITNPTVPASMAAGGFKLTTSVNGATQAVANVDINPGPAASFSVVTQHSGTETAGTSFSVTLTAKDQYNNTVTTYTGGHAITWTWTATSSPNFTAPTKPANGSQTFTTGVTKVNGFTLTNAGETPTITASDGTINGTSATITVNSTNTTTALRITANTTTPTVGANVQLTITAVEMYGNTTTGYTGNKNILFSGLANSPSGGVPTVTDKTQPIPVAKAQGTQVSLTFATGVASTNVAGQAILVTRKVETATLAANVQPGGTVATSAAGGAPLGLTVGPKALTVTGITASNKPYDGNTTATLAGTPGTLIGVITVGTPDVVTLGGTAAGTFADQHVGTGKTVTVSGQTLGGASASNYTLTEPTTTANITARPITVTAVTDTKLYDNSITSTGVPTITSGSLASGDSVTWTQTFDTKNVGTGKTLTPAGTVTDGNGGLNYSYTFVPVTTGVILPVNPTFTSVSPSSWDKGSPSHDMAVVGTGFASGAAVTFSGTGITVNSTTFNGTMSLTVNVTILSFAATSARDLIITNADTGTVTATGVFTVTPAPTFASVSPSNRGQGATNQSLTVLGANFDTGTIVSFSGTGITVNGTPTRNSSTSLTVNVTVSGSATTGAHDLTITDGDGGSVTASAAFTVNAGPTFTSVTLNHAGQRATNRNEAVAGTGFVNGAAVTFSGTGITVNSTIFTNPTSLTVNISVAADAPTGLRDLTITNPDAGTVTAVGAFLVNPAPTFGSVTPSSRRQGATDENLQVAGTGFEANTAVTFSGSGITVNSTTVNNSTWLTVNVTIDPAAATGARDLIITNSGGGNVTAPGAFTVNPLPTFTSVTPANRGQGATSQVLTIAGTGFDSGAVVSFGTGITVNSTTFHDSTWLTATVTISGSATTGTRDLIVTNTDGGAVTASGAFTVNTGPRFTSVTLDEIDQSVANANRTVAGTGFVNGAVVSFSGTGITVNSTLFGSSTSLTVNMSVAADATTGTRDLIVTNPDGGRVVGPSVFTVNYTPTYSSVTPSSLPQGATGVNLAVAGSYFDTGATVSFSGSGITINSTFVNNQGLLTVNVTIASNADTSTRDLTILSGDGGSVTASGVFSISAAPTFGSVAPTSRGQGGDSQSLTITGTGFVAGAVVSFGGSDIDVNSAIVGGGGTSIAVNITIAEFAATGARNLTITNPDTGFVTAIGAFTVTAAPTFTSVTPATLGQGATGQSLSVVGAGFASGATAAFGRNHITVNSTTYDTATHIIVNVTVAADAPIGERDLIITNPDGGTATGANAFIVNVGPTFTSVTPTQAGQRASNLDVVVAGGSFVSGASVSFSGDGITINHTTFGSDSSLTVNISISDSASPGARALTITNPDAGKVTQAGAFTVNAAPTLATVDPTSRGQGATNQSLAITGTGFVSGAHVTFSGSGITVNSTGFVSDVSLTANITITVGASTGLRDVTVTNPDGGLVVKTNAFTVNSGPTFTSITSDEVDQGATGDRTVLGTGFVAGAAVTFSGAGITVNGAVMFNSSTSLTVNITAAGNASLGSRDVTITNPDGGRTTATNVFRVDGAAGIISMSPSNLPQGATAVDIGIVGTAFDPDEVVAFSEPGITVNSTTYGDASHLTVRITISGSAGTGPCDVTASSVLGGHSTTVADAFTVNAAPRFTSVTPSSRGQRAPAYNLVVEGTGFAVGAAVTFSGDGITVNSTTYNSATSLTARVTIDAAAATTARNLTVTNTDTGTVTATNAFTVTAAPTFDSMTPSSLSQGATNRDLAIGGTGFVVGAVGWVSGWGITINSVTVHSPTSLTANITISQSADLGPRDFTITNPDGGWVGVLGGGTVTAAPTFTSVTPSILGQGAANQALTVTGTGFDDGDEVSISGMGISAISTTYGSATSLTVRVTIAGDAPTGARNLSIQDVNGGTITATDAFFVDYGPTFTSVTPSSRGLGTSNQDLAIVGTGIDPGAVVSFSGDGITVHSTTVRSQNSALVNIDVSAGATLGARDLTITNLDAGAVTRAGAFTVNVAPTITSVSPPSRGQGATNQNLTITGTGFVAGASLSFSGTGITVNSAIVGGGGTSITANIAVSGSAATGARTLTVTNSDAGAVTAAFTVNTGPTFTSITPRSVDQGVADTDRDIAGTGFVAGATVSFGGTGIAVNTVTFHNATSLTVNLTVTASAPAGERDLTITNPDGGSIIAPGAFDVSLPPTFTSLTPASWLRGATVDLAVVGTEFYAETTVTFNGGSDIRVNSTTVNSGTSLTVNITISPMATLGAHDLTIACGDGGTVTATGAFTVNGPPTFTSATPSSRGQGAMNQDILIRGTGFASNVIVAFSGSGITVNSTTYDIGSAGTALTANVTILPSAATGTRDLTITNTDTGTVTATGAFRVNAAPTFTSVTLDGIDQGVTGNRTVLGTGFVNGAAVSFSGAGITVNSMTFNGSTSLTVNISVDPAAATGTRDLTVTNPDAGSVTSTRVFGVNPPPTFTSVTPSSRPQGATAVDLAVVGNYFEDDTAVSFSGSGITVNSTTVNSQTSLTVNITIAGNATTGSRDMAILSGDGGSMTATGAFAVNAAPTFTSVTPASRGQAAGSQDLAIVGTGFVDQAVIVFSGTGVTVNSTTFVDAEHLTAHATVDGSAAIGARNLTITNPDTGTVTANSAFTVNAASTLSSVTPTSLGQGATNQDLVLAGTGFASGATVAFGHNNITINSITVVSSTSLTVNVTVLRSAVPGFRDLTITNADDGSVTETNAFTVTVGPTFSSVTPAQGSQGATNRDLTILGSGFVPGTAVSFSGTGIIVNSTTRNSSTSLTVNVTISGSAATGARDMEITNGAGGAVTQPGAFTVNAVPTFASVTPANHPQGAANQDLAVVGTNFVSGAAVTFSGSGITVNWTTFNSATTLTVNVTIDDSATAGARNLAITNNDGGTVTAPGAFTVTQVFSASHSTVSVASPAVESGSTDLVTLRANDGAGNLMSSGGATIELSASGGTSTGTFGAVADYRDGTYTAAFTGVLAGTATTIGATYNGTLIASTLPTITVTPVFSATLSEVSVASPTVASGATDLVTLTARDPNGNQMPLGGATVVFFYGGGTSRGTFGAVTDNGNGTYTATFTGVIAGTTVIIGATYNGTPIGPLLPTITVTSTAGSGGGPTPPPLPTTGTEFLPVGTTTTTIDTSDTVATVTGGGTITTATGTQPIESFNWYSVDGAATGVDLTLPQNVGGGISVTVGMAVTLISGTAGQPTTMATAALPNVSVTIPDLTNVLAPAGWDGKISPPTVGTSTGTPPPGFSVGSTVIEVGSLTEVLLLDRPASIILSGVTGTVGYRPTGSDIWVVINPCGPTGPEFPGACSVSDGINTTILTYYFSEFAALVRLAPTQQTVVATSTGVTCFVYSGPTTPASAFASVFATGVTAVNRFALPAGTYSSWFRTAPSLATLTSVSSGDVLCVYGRPIGTNVFAVGSAAGVTPPAIPPSAPAAVTTVATATGVYCFVYSGPATVVANFTTWFSPAIVGVNRMNLPDGQFSSWFAAVPALSTIASIGNGDLLCVAGPPASSVFAP